MSDMDIDSKSQYTNLNKENITPGNSPTKSILHNSPQQQLARSRFPQGVNSNMDYNDFKLPKLNHTTHTHEIKTQNAKTKRLASVAQLYFLDYYCEMFDYVINRRDRTKLVEQKLMNDPNFSGNAQRQQLEWKNYIWERKGFVKKEEIKA